jgi:chromosome partitioning protein
MPIIAIANQKGGVGKTTTAVNLSACLARSGKNTLLIDLDAQGNATNHLGIDVKDNGITSYEILADKKCDPNEAITPIFPNLQLISASLALAEIDLVLSSTLHRESRLTKAIERIESPFDYIIIDTPPNLGMATLNAFVASTAVIVAIQTNWFGLEAIKRLMAILEDVVDEANPSLEVFALATLHRSNVVVNREMLDAVQKTFGESLFQTVIRHTATLAEASASRMPISEYAHGCRGHQDYQALTEEIIRLSRQDPSRLGKTVRIGASV